MKHVLTLLAMLSMSAGQPSFANEDRDPFSGGATVSLPLLFASANGGTFRPKGLVIETRSGSYSVAFPNRGFDARSDDRAALSGLPLIGGLFRPGLTPSNAERLGEVWRSGDMLYVKAQDWPGELVNAPVTLATWTPRFGRISYRLGRQDYRLTGSKTVAGAILGTALLVNGQVVIASNGSDIPSLNDVVRGTF